MVHVVLRDCMERVDSVSERGVLSFEYTPDANYSSFGIKGKRARKGLYGHWKHSNEIEMPLILP